MVSAKNAGSYGLCVVIEDEKGYQSRYAHCASLSVNADLKDTIKSMCTELFEGKYADGAAFCAALDALY